MWAMDGEPFDLMWGARRDLRGVAAGGGPGASECKRILKSYKEGVAQLSDPAKGDFAHGFNSGVVAFARLVLGLGTTEDDDGVECHPEEEATETEGIRASRDAAWDEYPMLDS